MYLQGWLVFLAVLERQALILGPIYTKPELISLVLSSTYQ